MVAFLLGKREIRPFTLGLSEFQMVFEQLVVSQVLHLDDDDEEVLNYYEAGPQQMYKWRHPPQPIGFY